jgi:hypothetical protein
VTTFMSFLRYVIIRSLDRGLHGSRVQVDEHSTYVLRRSLTPGVLPFFPNGTDIIGSHFGYITKMVY